MQTNSKESEREKRQTYTQKQNKQTNKKQENKKVRCPWLLFRATSRYKRQTDR